MKKVLFLGAAIALFGMTSCKKDYDCTCSGDWSWDEFNASGTIPSTSYTIEDAKEDDAKAECDDSEAQIKSQMQGIPDEANININCSISEK